MRVRTGPHGGGFDNSSPINRRILAMQVEGATYKAIAAAVGLTWWAVRARISQARKRGWLEPRQFAVKWFERDEKAAWERLRAELAEQHRREFVGSGLSDPFKQHPNAREGYEFCL